MLLGCASLLPAAASAFQPLVTDAMSTGGHFNPTKQKHGGPYDPVKHAGDLGNLVFNDAGVAKINFTVGDISVSKDKPDGIIGKGLIVHAVNDDLKTDPTGNAGGRVACGVIQAATGSGRTPAGGMY